MRAPTRLLLLGRPDALPIAVAPAGLGERESLRFSRLLPVLVLSQF